ncbi:hypothetical protein [Herbihabitans rhizosphaerae]|uniref:hypothetical protein n=1 Tax=Herbihabitans rhizosphaerae TaxID=1872711 RepID=UPI00102BC7D0|nr:hypothetical protein [Herbihabitans rhizosphaerae]
MAEFVRGEQREIAGLEGQGDLVSLAPIAPDDIAGLTLSVAFAPLQNFAPSRIAPSEPEQESVM